MLAKASLALAVSVVLGLVLFGLCSLLSASPTPNTASAAQVAPPSEAGAASAETRAAAP